MTESLLQRLHDALQPRYAVRDKLGEGGMAIVYLGYDHSLDREVAIKVLRPELATALLAERFLREAQASAGIRHPNVVAIHDFGEADGLNYFVMDLVEGETLRARLDRGPLPHDEAVTVALQILEALDAAHALGIVHRDIKPANIFLSDGRALLGDFGIAKRVDSTTGLTKPNSVPGTPAYMAPEQVTGAATEATDIHAVGMVLYESLTGRHWMAFGGGDRDWTGIPRRTASSLRVALNADPEKRWQTAEEFGSRLGLASRPSPLTIAAATVVVIAGVLLVGMLTGEREAPGVAAADLALSSCLSLPGSAELAKQLEFVASGMMRDVLGARFAPQLKASRPVPATALSARRVATCRVIHQGADSLRITVRLVDREGGSHHLPPIIAPAEDPPLAGAAALALRLIEAVDPAMPLSSTGYANLQGHDPEAVSAFLSGALAFRRDARIEAIRHFADAVAIDSTFTLAKWRLGDGQRWAVGTQTAIDLDRLFSEHSEDLGEVDRRMLEAVIARRGKPQFELYEQLIEDYPNDPYATLLYGDELFHRGPLFGVGLDSALAVLQRAAGQDSFLAPAYDHLAWLEIRLGNAEGAIRALDHLDSIAGDMVLPRLLRLGYVERFAPQEAAALRGSIFGPGAAGEPGLLIRAVRFPATIGMPETQLDLGRSLIRASGASSNARNGPHSEARISGYLAEGLALWTLGRPGRAAASFDSAAATANTPEGRLVAAQWRVLPAALDMVGVSEAEREAGAVALSELALDRNVQTGLRARAAWSLSLLAAADNRAAAARRWLDELQALPLTGGDSALGLLAEAVLAAQQGDVPGALAISAPLADYDSASIVERPFQRAVAHLKRGEWLDLSGRPDSADSAWIWYENLDLEGIPTAEIQAADIDWSWGVHARLLRARLGKRSGNDVRACRLAAEVIRYWSDAAPQYATLVEEARSMCAP